MMMMNLCLKVMGLIKVRWIRNTIIRTGWKGEKKAQTPTLIGNMRKIWMKTNKSIALCALCAYAVLQ